ncbi:MAG: ketoacyl-ACP synthase III [Firmicutes bacterium]|nr:ketoacyl-ACP synthase III [Candidatus Fermentithermobacillaceae bacterium]HRC53615.1 beta-ketoacyl-ACP synthase III [Bacillota bacterium]
MKNSVSATIESLGVYVPPDVLTNADLEKMVETSNEWIVERTGIRERRIASKDISTSDLAARAALSCLSSSKVSAEDIDLIIVATASPDYAFPATACIVQEAIGAKRAAAFDVEIGCTGFIYALAIGSQFIVSGVYKNVLVIGAETLSRLINWKDRNTCVLFGDGAGAAMLTRGNSGEGILGFHLGVDGSQRDLLYLPAGMAKLPASCDTVSQGLHYVHMEGKAVFKFAVKTMDSAVTRLLEDIGKTADDIDLLIPHQANIRIIESAIQRFKIPREKVMINIEKYGNTSSASIPIALYEAYEQGRINKGDLVVLVGFGAGLSWGSIAINW